MFIRIGDDYFNVNHIACVRPVDDGEDQCVIFTVGQSATDQGFLIDLGIDEVFEMIQAARLIEIADMLPNSDPGDESPIMTITADESKSEADADADAD